MSSIIYILFLIYGSHIKLNNFFFQFVWDWYVVSAFWDIFILLTLLFLYTFWRYIVYWVDNINDNWYFNLRLYEILKTRSSALNFN